MVIYVTGVPLNAAVVVSAYRRMLHPVHLLSQYQLDPLIALLHGIGKPELHIRCIKQCLRKDLIVHADEHLTLFLLVIQSYSSTMCECQSEAAAQNPAA